MAEYTIDIPQSKIDNLRTKLSQATFPDELDDSGWDYGTPLSEMKRLVAAWQTWDWRQAETKLNELPNFHTSVEVEGFEPLDIHFVHQKSDVEGAIPLLFVHGWPGSFIEVTKLIPELTTGSPAFHVVAPSLPNFGFSEGVRKRGFGVSQYAETVNNLMLKLGYNEYVTQGGDWGTWITRAVGFRYPEHCKASHLNYIRALAPSWTEAPLLALQHSITPYSEREKAGLKRGAWFASEGQGYSAEQATKPQTLGYGLADSPVALLAWIYEKLHDWSDSYPWTDDEILTWVSIYAFSRAGPGAAQRIYYEFKHASGDGPRSLKHEPLLKYIDKVKLGLTFSPQEIQRTPITWAKTMGDVVLISENDDGGHFLAHERPQYIIRDLQKMFGKGGGAYGVVKGRSGYDVRVSRL